MLNVANLGRYVISTCTCINTSKATVRKLQKYFQRIVSVVALLDAVLSL